MTADASSYVFDSLNECNRLEAQAVLQGLESLLDYVPVPPHGRVLDAGCGSGAMARLLASRNPGAQVVGTDINENYIDFARNKAAAGKLDNLSFDVADIRANRDGDASFDVIWSQFVLFFLPNPRDAVREFRRLVRPGGTVVVSLHYRSMLTNFPVEPDLQTRLDRVLYGLADIELAKKMPMMFREFGFTDISVSIEADRVYSTIGRIDPARRQNVTDILTSGLPRIAQILDGSQANAATFLADWLAYLDRPDTCSYTTLWVVKAVAP